MLPESAPSKSKRLFYLKIQYIFYGTTVAAAFIFVVPLVISNPRFPCFINSVWPTVYSSENNFEKFLPYIFGFWDIFPCYNSWESGAAFDIATSMMSRTISNAMDRIINSLTQRAETATTVVEVNEILKIYNALRILVTNMNSAFGRLIFTHEMLNLATQVLCMYAAVQSGLPIIYPIYLSLNSIFLGIRMYLIYLPLVTVLVKSRELRNLIARYDDQQIRIGRKLEQNPRQIAVTMRDLLFKPWGLHGITSTSISDYLLAVSCYFVTVRQP